MCDTLLKMGLIGILKGGHSWDKLGDTMRIGTQGYSTLNSGDETLNATLPRHTLEAGTTVILTGMRYSAEASAEIPSGMPLFIH